MERITTPEGIGIVLHSTGAGPGIVVVHGSGTTIAVYRRLGTCLAGRGFTVHMYNRRGRADAASRPVPYTVEQDISDLAAVLQHTGAGNVIGHSYGGFIALRAALHLSIGRLALYDATICVDGGFPTGWLTPAREALHAGDTARAVALMGAGLNTNSPASKLPLSVQTAVCRGFLRTSIGRTMGDLLPTGLDEMNQVLAYDGPAAQWAGITTDVLLAYGAAGPPYHAEINQALARALPNARTLAVPRSRHDAINRARPRLVDPLAAYFRSPVAPARTPRT
jgi:pimeloyl-ACP methyl ester carboxylesterase